MELTFTPMRPADIAPLTPIMKRAFDEDTRLHLGRPAGGPTGYADGSFLRQWGLHKESAAFCIWHGDALVGGVILWLRDKTQHNTLGCIFLDPAVQNRGLGTRVWQRIEASYPETRVWEAETPLYSRRNQHFYIDKCGFAAVAMRDPQDEEHGMFVLQKRMPGWAEEL